jgi:hypothetical protein
MAKEVEILTKNENLNRPLRNSIIWGIAYLLFTLMLDFHEAFELFYSISMWFLPGITFPISTTFYSVNQEKENHLNHYLHLIGSIGIYYSGVWIFSAEGYFEFAPIIAGFIGSFFYLSITKYLLLKELNWKGILSTAILSGLGFGLILLIDEKISLGIALLIWTISNGYIIDKEIKKNTTANRVDGPTS